MLTINYHEEREKCENSNFLFKTLFGTRHLLILYNGVFEKISVCIANIYFAYDFTVTIVKYFLNRRDFDFKTVMISFKRTASFKYIGK